MYLCGVPPCKRVPLSLYLFLVLEIRYLNVSRLESSSQVGGDDSHFVTFLNLRYQFPEPGIGRLRKESWETSMASFAHGMAGWLLTGMLL